MSRPRRSASTVFLVFAVLLFSVVEVKANWVLPPIRLNGELAHTVRQRDLSDRGKSDENLSTLRLKANTYLWEPWFARVDAGFTVGVTKIDRDTETSSSDVNGYHGKFSLFPYSRFPTEIYFQRDDSRLENFEQDAGVSSELLVFLSDFTNTRYGINQIYVTPEGTRYWLRAENNEFNDEEGTDISTVVNLGLNSMIQFHKLDLSFRLFDVDRAAEGEDNNDKQSVVRHSYRPDSSFSVENILDYNIEDTEFDDDKVTRFENLQFTSFSLWKPATSYPLRLNGNLRLNQTNRRSDLEETKTEVENVSIGAVYDVTQRTQITASAGISESSNSEGQEGETNFQTLGARYRSRQYDIGGFGYSWSPFATVTNEEDESSTSQIYDAGLAHDLRRRIPLSEYSNLSLSLGQTANVRETDVEDQGGATLQPRANEERLTNQGSIRWSRNNSSSSSQISLTLGESREFGEQSSRLELANLQISGTQYFSRLSSLSGNITLQQSQFSDEEQERETGNSRNTSSSLSARFTKQRLFGIRRFQFTSEYLKTDREFRTDLDDSNPLLAERRADQVWDNRLKYSIGRIELSLIARAAERDGQTERSIIARAIRRILR